MLLRLVDWTPALAVALNLIVYGVGFRMLRGVARIAASRRSAVARRWFDLPLRAVVIAVFVSAVVVGSAALGPAMTGIAAVFPISLSSLIVTVQPRIGGAATALLAASALQAMLGFGLGLLVLHLAIPPLGMTKALVSGLAAMLAWSAGLLVCRRWGAVG